METTRKLLVELYSIRCDKDKEALSEAQAFGVGGLLIGLIACGSGTYKFFFGNDPASYGWMGVVALLGVASWLYGYLRSKKIIKRMDDDQAFFQAEIEDTFKIEQEDRELERQSKEAAHVANGRGNPG